MIIFILCIVALIVSIVGALLSHKYDADLDNTVLAVIVYTALLVFAVIDLVIIPNIIYKNSKMHYNKVYTEYETKQSNLLSRVENWKNGDISDANLWSDVQAYNVDIKTKHRYRDNPWVNIFYSSAYDEFEEIEIPKYVADDK